MLGSTKLVPRLSPSILSADFSILYEDCKKVLEGGADSLHMDIMDGHFVPNLTFGVPVIKCLRKRLPDAHFDVHLIVQKPQDYILPLKQAQANHITFFYQATYTNLIQLCKQIRSYNIGVGVSIKPATQINEQILQLIRGGYVDVFVLMTVEPGFGGQKLIPDVLEKAKLLRKEFPLLNIQLDGGVYLENIQKVLLQSGANYIISGSGIYDAKDYRQVIKQMQSILKRHFP